MNVALTALDIAIFLGSLALIMGVGLWSGRKENTAEDFFLAGRNVPWWGVAGSIFGTNVSANHLVGMMGIGYSVGFAQSHFELGAIVALMVLCYLLLPLYRRMRVYTLSEYLGRRYDARCQVLYSLVALIVITLIQMVMAFYIGSRSMMFLLRDTPLEFSYITGILIFAAVTTVYTVVGGLKAVIWTDVIQSALLLLAGIFVAMLVFSQPEIGGFSGLMAQDAVLPAAEQKFQLYLPSDHPDLPWTGVITGLMFLHLFYWGTNQFIVQRALAARSGFDARMGIVAAGYLKLLIPFFAVAGGIAAGHLFRARLATGLIAELPQPDDAFPLLVRLVVPAGYGLTGLITAGLIGAILSSIDSMMNSGATLFTFDFYKKYVRPNASQRRLLLVGRISIVVLVIIAATLAALFYTEKEGDNFFLKIASQQGHLTPGVLVAFLIGVLWRGATGHGAVAAILSAPFFSVFFERAYAVWVAGASPLAEAAGRTFGPNLNFMHRTAVTVVFAALVLIAVSHLTQRSRNRDGERFTWGVYRSSASDEPERPFWRSERPWAWLLVGLMLWMMVSFA